MVKKVIMVIVSVVLLSFIVINAVNAADAEMLKQDDLQAQIDAVMNAIPKFAIPMREVNDRFQNMYFAAKGGNWGLAAYMSKYMDAAMNPAKLTKPSEYPAWSNFYSETFAPVNKAIMAQDFKSFEKEFMAVIGKCNECHAGLGYRFIKVIKQKTASNAGIDYSVKSKATDVPK
jgi:hypothetical protein